MNPLGGVLAMMEVAAVDDSLPRFRQLLLLPVIFFAQRRYLSDWIMTNHQALCMEIELPPLLNKM